MKKFISMSLVLVMALGLVACGLTDADGDADVDGNADVEGEADADGDADADVDANADVELQTVVEAIKAAYGETYYPNMPVEGDMIKDMYGITSDLYEEIVIEIPMISAQSDFMIAMKVAEGKQEDALAAVTAYREKIVNDLMQYPMNQLKLQSSLLVEKEGFIFLVSLGDIPMEVFDAGDAAVTEKAVEQNKIAQDAIDALLK